ncbi:MAG: hypothetical protein EOO45_16450, partial [Flavobacterium sp.]
MLSEFPFLQSARAIHLKGLYNLDSFRYNTELKKTAAYTTDRSVLFDFITTEQFQSIEINSFEENEKLVEEMSVTSEVVSPPINKLEESIKLTIKEATPEPEPEIVPEIHIVEEPESETETPSEAVQNVEKAEEKLEIGKPLEFVHGEKHSFQEWLQLSKLSPIVREDDKENLKTEPLKSKQDQIIDKFIETNPKIVPVRNMPQPPANIEKPASDTSYLMTETLAKVYLEQKKYQKAIQA